MSIRLNGSTSGYTEIDAPAVAGSNTLVLPTGNGTADQALVTDGSGALSFADRGRMVLETAKTATGTSIDFTGIPSWVKRVTVMFSGVSTSGTSNILIQLGASGGVQSTGYLGASSVMVTTVNTYNSTEGFIHSQNNAANITHGSFVITNFSGNLWVCQGVCGRSNSPVTVITVGSVTLSGTLDRVRITTVNGTDTFDAGSVNLLIEG